MAAQVLAQRRRLDLLLDKFHQSGRVQV
jgi:hypothetical protein